MHLDVHPEQVEYVVCTLKAHQLRKSDRTVANALLCYFNSLSADCLSTIQPGYSFGNALTSSIFLRSSADNINSVDLILSFSWSIFLAPMMVLVTPFCSRTHASAISADGDAILFADFGYHIDNIISFFFVDRREVESVRGASLLPFHCSRVYLPDKNPPASGLQGIMAKFWSAASGNNFALNIAPGQ